MAAIYKASQFTKVKGYIHAHCQSGGYKEMSSILADQ